jgi:hypothetical protein
MPARIRAMVAKARRSSSFLDQESRSLKESRELGCWELQNEG